MKIHVLNFIERLSAWIPSHIGGGFILWSMDLLSRAEHFLLPKGRGRKEKRGRLSDRQQKAPGNSAGFIEDQNAWTDIPYGRKSIQYSGCEIIALFNALHSLKKCLAISMEDLISEFERDGIVLSGSFGTSPKAIRRFLEKEGYETILSTSPQEFASIAKNYDSLIYMFYNDSRDIRKEIHSVNISKGPNGFTAHNVCCDGRAIGPDSSFEHLVSGFNRGRTKGIALIGIRL